MPDDRFALIVATSQYSDPTLTALEAPARDAESLSDVLGSPEIGGFAVETLLDRPAAKVMQEIESFFEGRRREDLVLLYFSGHGILDDGARLYFATTDTQVERPRSTAVPAAFVNELMNESRSRRQVLVLDCCNSGAFARGIKAGGNIGTGERFEGRGKVVITASDALQYAFEAGHVDGEGIRSVFTHVLVDGLRTGEADLDRDGYVGLDELYDYVYGRVLDESPRQRPRKWAFDVEGQIFLARTSEAAAALPPAQTTTTEPAAKTRATQGPRKRRLSRRTVGIAAAAAALVGLAAVLAVVLLTGGSGSSSSSEPPTSLEDGRTVTLRVFDAWQSGKLASLDASDISTSARRTLSQMPIEPVTPVPPAPNDCSGTPEETGCNFSYPGLNITLLFTVLKYSSGLRLADVRCYDSTTGNPIDGGIASCAKIVEKA
jgi:caspase domain-containing protein